MVVGRSKKKKKKQIDEIDKDTWTAGVRKDIKKIRMNGN